MIAEGFVLSGANVYITGREEKALLTKANELNALVKSRSGKGQCNYIVADLQTVKGVNKIVEDLGKREKALHVLVNNAGANWGADLEDYPDEAFTKVLTLNLQRVFTLTQKCIPLMTASLAEGKDHEGPWARPANIINIGSVDGIRVPSLQTYACMCLLSSAIPPLCLARYDRWDLTSIDSRFGFESWIAPTLSSLGS